MSNIINIILFAMMALIAVGETIIAVILTRDATHTMDRCDDVMRWCEDESRDLRDEEGE